MHSLVTQLRIGEKIAAGFGLVGLLFIAVIWQYQDTLSRSLTDYRQLQKIQAAGKDTALAIEKELLQARMAEKQFQLSRDLQQAEQVNDHISKARRKLSSLSTLDANSALLSEKFKAYLENYLGHFEDLKSALIRKGLDENAGLQGSFREAVHELQALAGNLNTDHIYLNLLKIRRAEKDLGLRREGLYQQLVFELTGQFEAYVQEAELLQSVKEQLLVEIANYRTEFSIYARNVLQGGDLHGGKGAFRDAANRIEKIIDQYYVPDLERDILQLRRREKDYLLRGDKQYVEMAVRQIEVIKDRVLLAGISDVDREKFLQLLQRYRKDFLLLVEQNDQITVITEQMEQAARHIVDLVTFSVQSANHDMDGVIQTITATTQQRTEWMFWVIVSAVGLGIFFAYKITRHIVEPLHNMTAMLERLTYTDLVDPVHHVKGGRDEINVMAGYLNTLSEHRNRFVNWWKNAMQEANACEKMQKIITQEMLQDQAAGAEVNDLKAEMHEVLSTKQMLISSELDEVYQEAGKILNASALLQHPSIPRGDVDEQSQAIHYSAEMIRKSLNMLYGKTRN